MSFDFSIHLNAVIPSLFPCSIPAWLAPVCEDKSVSHSLNVCDFESIKPLTVGIKSFYTDSNGNKVDNPRYLEKTEKKLARERRRLSRKQSGSKNYKKQRIKVAKVYEKIKDQRNDFQQKQSTKLLRENKTVCIENLNVQGIKRNHKLAKQITSVSWSSFFYMLDYKAKWYGNTIIRVPNNYKSSQTCNCCGYQYHRVQTANLRYWECPKCHAKHDRDINASINILNKGLEKI